MSRRAALAQAAKSDPAAARALENPLGAPPEEAEHVWGWFLELSATRSAGFAAVAPVTFLEIRAWAELTGERPTPAEVRLIRRLDDSFREAAGSGRKKEGADDARRPGDA